MAYTSVSARFKCRNSIMRPKASAALAAFARDDDGRLCIALVRPRCSYAFRDIIFGWWQSPEYCARLASQVTAEEAAVLLLADYPAALGYMTIKARAQSDDKLSQGNPRFASAEAKFRSVIDTAAMQTALKTAPFECIGWSVPRGRARSNETNMECAIREFSEETGFRPMSGKPYSPLCGFRMQNDCTRVDEYSGTNGNYRIAYHCATLAERPALAVSGAKQLCEIAEVRWVVLRDAQQILDPRQVPIVMGFSRFLRKRKRL
jgi:8-oxo-dGTP pyrophosphatase MutT (NUDIX family)